MKLSIFLLAGIAGFASVKAQTSPSTGVPYPDDQFFIEHAHSELVADIQFGNITEGQPVILYGETDKGAPNQLWLLTHEGYIKSVASDNQNSVYYLAIQGNRGQALDNEPSVIISKFPQIWEVYNGALSIPGLHYGISYTGNAAANTPLVIKSLDIFDKSQQFRLERLFEEQKSGQIENAPSKK